jgi:hypothetical protein
MVFSHWKVEITARPDIDDPIFAQCIGALVSVHDNILVDSAIEAHFCVNRRRMGSACFAALDAVKTVLLSFSVN